MITRTLALRALNSPTNNIVASMLASKQKDSTRETYRQNIRYFAWYLLNGAIIKGQKIVLPEDEIKAIFEQFLKLDRNLANSYVLDYKNKLLEGGYSPNSVNIKLASIRSLVFYAFKLDYCAFTLDISKLPSENYRDTKGTNIDNITKILSGINQDTISGKRDYAILRLLWDNALRRSEISNLTIEDFNLNGTLKIKGKGKFSKETIYLSSKTVEAVKQWLAVRYNPTPNQPLFISLATNTNGHSLTGKSIYCIVRKYADEILTDKILSPHRVRHSSITAVLDASNGNVRLAQKLSRHKNLDVLTRYDDNRVALQREAVNLLADMV